MAIDFPASVELPAGWGIHALEEIADICLSSVDKRSEPNEAPVSVCRHAVVRSNSRIHASLEFETATASAAEIQKFELKPGDVVLTTNPTTENTIASAVVVEALPATVLCGQNLILIRPHEQLQGAFLAFALRSRAADSHFAHFLGDSARYHLPLVAVREARVLLPPWSEQQRISSALAVVEEATRMTSAVIGQGDHVHEVMSQLLMTHGIAGLSDSARVNDSRRGDVLPAGWTRSQLGEVCEKISVGISSTTTHAYSERGVPIVRNHNIKPGYIELSELRYVTPEFDDANRRKRVHTGDVLTTRTGNAGTSAMVPPELNNAQTFSTLISCPRKGVLDPEFLATWLNSGLGRHAARSARVGALQQNLNVSTFKALLVPIPPFAEQREIVDMLRTVSASVARNQASLAELRILAQGLIDDLISGTVRIVDGE